MLEEYQYKGLNEKGELVSGIVLAPDELSARTKVENRGIEVVKLTPQPVLDKLASEIKNYLGLENVRLSDKQSVVFFKELRSYIRAGLTLKEGLEHIYESREVDPQMARFAGGILYMIEDGVSFGDALRQIGFKSSIADMIDLGAKMGTHLEAIEAIIRQLELSLKVRKELMSAFAGPVIMVAIILISTVLVNIYVIPLQEKVIRSLIRTEEDIPPLSRITFWIGEYGNLIIYSMVGLMLLAYIGAKIVAAINPRFRIWLDGKKQSLPVFGNFYKNQELANISFMLSFSLLSGEKPTKILEIMHGQISSPFLKDKVRRAYLYVKERGDLMSKAFDEVNLNKAIVTFLRRAEISDRETGASYMEDVAESFRDRTMVQLELIKSMAETLGIFLITISSIPILLVTLGPSLDQITLIMNRVN